MIKFNLTKSVKSEDLKSRNIIVSVNRLELYISKLELDIFAFDLSHLRDTLSIKQCFSEIGLFTDADGVTGLATYCSSSINFFYPKDNGKQVLADNNGLQSINFPQLHSKLFIDTVVLHESSPLIKDLSIRHVEYVTDNGVIFNVNDNLYSLIF